MQDVRRDELPIWMQKTMRSTDWGVLIVLAFSLLAAWSLLLNPGLPNASPSEHYAYRAAETARAFAEGRLYPRWSAEALGGYGAPIPHYTPPGAAYAAGMITYFVTGDATTAVKLVYAGTLLLAGAAVYALVTRRSGAAAGVAAALLYVYSPYLGLTAPHVLGDLPGMMSLALIPALLWGADRLLRTNHPLDLLMVAMTTAGLLLTAVPAGLAGWILTLMLVTASAGARKSGARVVTAGVLGIGLAAFYWLPALAEANAVQWFARPTALQPSLNLLELFSPLTRLDPAAQVHLPQLTLGLALPLAVLASLPMMARRRNFHGLFLAAGVVVLALGVTVLRREVWLLGLGTLCLAISASALVFWSKSRLLLPMVCGVVLGAALPLWTMPPGTQDYTTIDTAPLALIEYEQRGFGIAGLPDGMALPSSIAPTTPVNRALISEYRSGGVVNKVEQSANTQVGVLEHGTHGDRLQIQTFADATLNVLTAAFPGWTARLGNNTLSVSQSDEGLLRVAVPNNVNGELTLALESTAPRLVGWMVAGGAAAILIVFSVQRNRQKRSESSYEPLNLLSSAQARLLAVLLIGFGMVLGLVALPQTTLAGPLQAGSGLAGSATLDNRSEAGLELLAYRVEQRHAARGAVLPLTLYWQTTRPVPSNYGVRVSLLDLATGEYRARTPLRAPGGLPTLRWLPNRYIPDQYAIVLPATMPSGNYSPALEVCAAADCGSGNRLTFQQTNGEPYGPVLVLPVVVSIS